MCYFDSDHISHSNPTLYSSFMTQAISTTIFHFVTQNILNIMYVLLYPKYKETKAQMKLRMKIQACCIFLL